MQLRLELDRRSGLDGHGIGTKPRPEQIDAVLGDRGAENLLLESTTSA